MNAMNFQGDNAPYYHDITIKDIRIENHHGHNRTGVDGLAHIFSLEGHFDNISVSSVQYTGTNPPSSLNGINGGISNVSFNHCKNDAGPITQDSDWDLTRSGTVSGVSYT